MDPISTFLDDPRFSRTVDLPADPANGRPGQFRVTYADYGYRNEAHPEEERVLLFFGPLVGSRFVYVGKDELAKKHRVRIINTDRPGFGDTDNVAPERRLAVWREIMPALLAHLQIPHVSVACHSGGTVPALDFALHHPQLLDASRGPARLAICAPWILPAHSTSALMALTKSLPAAAIAQADTLFRVVYRGVGVVGASTGFSAGVFARLTALSGATAASGVGRAAADDAAAAGAEEDEEAAVGLEQDGAAFEERLGPKVMERIFAGGVRGVAADALVLLLKSADTAGGVGWADWGDHDRLVPLLAAALRGAGLRLKVDVFFAQSDVMIGPGGSKGPQWFDSCWNAEACDGVVEYSSTTVQGADHDGIWNIRWGVPQTVFEGLGQPVVQVQGDASGPTDAE